MITKITGFITRFHERMFDYLKARAATSVWFSILLALAGIYELFEHIVIPALLAAWAYMEFVK